MTTHPANRIAVTAFWTDFAQIVISGTSWGSFILSYKLSDDLKKEGNPYIHSEDNFGLKFVVRRDVEPQLSKGLVARSSLADNLKEGLLEIHSCHSDMIYLSVESGVVMNIHDTVSTSSEAGLSRMSMLIKRKKFYRNLSTLTRVSYLAKLVEFKIPVSVSFVRNCQPTGRRKVLKPSFCTKCCIWPAPSFPI